MRRPFHVIRHVTQGGAMAIRINEIGGKTETASASKTVTPTKADPMRPAGSFTPPHNAPVGVPAGPRPDPSVERLLHQMDRKIEQLQQSLGQKIARLEAKIAVLESVLDISADGTTLTLSADTIKLAAAYKLRLGGMKVEMKSTGEFDVDANNLHLRSSARTRVDSTQVVFNGGTRSVAANADPVFYADPPAVGTIRSDRWRICV